MFPPSVTTGVPPLPPEIAAQQAQSQMPAAAAFARMQPSMPDPVQALKAKVMELEKWAGETDNLLRQLAPGAAPLLVPIAEAGKALAQEIATLEQQRSTGPSPMVTGSVPPNLPGNMPDGRPAA